MFLYHSKNGHDGLDTNLDSQDKERITRKNLPSPYQNEVSDAGFAYTNQICIAGEDCRPISSLRSRQVLA